MDVSYGVEAARPKWSQTRTSQLTGVFFRKLDQLYDALIDPAQCERAAIGVLAAYLLLWTLYAVVAKSSQDIHIDMAELIVWSRDLAFGFFKHSPLAAIVVSLWFDIFPAPIGPTICSRFQ